MRRSIITTVLALAVTVAGIGVPASGSWLAPGNTFVWTGVSNWGTTQGTCSLTDGFSSPSGQGLTASPGPDGHYLFTLAGVGVNLPGTYSMRVCGETAASLLEPVIGGPSCFGVSGRDGLGRIEGPDGGRYDLTQVEFEYLLYNVTSFQIVMTGHYTEYDSFGQQLGTGRLGGEFSTQGLDPCGTPGGLTVASTTALQFTLVPTP